MGTCSKCGRGYDPFVHEPNCPHHLIPDMSLATEEINDVQDVLDVDDIQDVPDIDFDFDID